MTLEEKINHLISKCKCEVLITFNGHRDYDVGVKDYLGDNIAQISPEIFSEMERLDSVVRIQFYPDTPVGAYTVYHYTLEAALNDALECLESNDGN